MKKIVLNLDDETFQLLEVLAFGLKLEEHEDNKNHDDFSIGYSKKNDDFAPMVSRLLENISCSLGEGIRRPGSWERGVIDSLTGWNGTYNRGMLGELIKKMDEFKENSN